MLGVAIFLLGPLGYCITIVAAGNMSAESGVWGIGRPEALLVSAVMTPMIWVAYVVLSRGVRGSLWRLSQRDARVSVSPEALSLRYGGKDRRYRWETLTDYVKTPGAIRMKFDHADGVQLVRLDRYVFGHIAFAAMEADVSHVLSQHEASRGSSKTLGFRDEDAMGDEAGGKPV
jgi:hypothetical protein